MLRETSTNQIRKKTAGDRWLHPTRTTTVARYTTTTIRTQWLDASTSPHIAVAVVVVQHPRAMHDKTKDEDRMYCV